MNRRLILIFLPIIPLLGGMALYWNLANNEPIRCSLSQLDFGRVPVNGEHASAEREITIENTTKEDIEIGIKISCPCLQSNGPSKLPAKSSTTIKFVITLPPHEFQRRRIDIYIVPEKKKISPIALTAYASVAFSTHVMEKELDLGLVPNMGTCTKKFTAITASSMKLDKPILRIESNHPETIKTKIVRLTPQKLLDEKEKTYWIYNSHIEVEMNPLPTTPLGRGNAIISLYTSDNAKLEVPVKWHLFEKTAFEPKEFRLISLSPNEHRKINIVYNRDVGGKEITILPEGENLKLIETRVFDRQVFIELEYRASKEIKNGEILSQVIIRTEDNRTHSLPIIAD